MQPTVAVVDDNDLLRRLCCAIAKRAGYKSVSYTNGRDFLDNYCPDFACVILDMNMPGLDGLATLRELKGLGATVPVIVCSSDGEFASAACELGAMAFIEKPFRVGELADLIEKAISIRTH